MEKRIELTLIVLAISLGSTIGIWLAHIYYGVPKEQLKKEKPISYPEEIQIAKAGDTLYVSSVSDSIYINFKNK